jgi:acyl-CoA thioester hydrolase
MQDRVSRSLRSTNGRAAFLASGRIMAAVHEMEFRVRYQETDGQRRVHHANFLTYFEMGRTEMLRAHGHTYRQFEDDGLFMVVSEAHVSYRAPADYDDLLRLRTRVEKIGAAHIKHAYEVIRGTQILVTGSTTVVCVDREGKVRRLPEWMLG